MKRILNIFLGTSLLFILLTGCHEGGGGANGVSGAQDLTPAEFVSQTLGTYQNREGEIFSVDLNNKIYRRSLAPCMTDMRGTLEGVKTYKNKDGSVQHLLWWKVESASIDPHVEKPSYIDDCKKQGSDLPLPYYRAESMYEFNSNYLMMSWGSEKSFNNFIRTAYIKQGKQVDVTQKFFDGFDGKFTSGYNQSPEGLSRSDGFEVDKAAKTFSVSRVTSKDCHYSFTGHINAVQVFTRDKVIGAVLSLDGIKISGPTNEPSEKNPKLIGPVISDCSKNKEYTSLKQSNMRSLKIDIPVDSNYFYTDTVLTLPHPETEANQSFYKVTK